MWRFGTSPSFASLFPASSVLLILASAFGGIGNGGAAAPSRDRDGVLGASLVEDGSLRISGELFPAPGCPGDAVAALGLGVEPNPDPLLAPGRAPARSGTRGRVDVLEVDPGVEVDAGVRDDGAGIPERDGVAGVAGADGGAIPGRWAMLRCVVRRRQSFWAAKHGGSGGCWLPSSAIGGQRRNVAVAWVPHVTTTTTTTRQFDSSSVHASTLHSSSGQRAGRVVHALVWLARLSSTMRAV